MVMQGTAIEDYESAPMPPTGLPSHEVPGKKAEEAGAGYVPEEVTVGPPMDDDSAPTLEEMSTLRKVAAPMPWIAIAMCLVEFAERASYYGSSGPFNNFINNPLPDGGPGTGAVAPGDAGLNESAGALGLGSVDASALVNLFTFLAYVIPIYGGIVADTRWGRFKAIFVGTVVGAVAHVLLIIPALPPVIKDPKGSMGAFIVAIIILAFAAGFIKPSLGPLLCDQSPVKTPTVITTKKGERVILDPQVTVERWLLIFYACINIGAFFAVATEYAERLVGFWLAFLLPGIVYMLMPIVLVLAYKHLYHAPPQGSVVIETVKVFGHLLKNGGWYRMFRGGPEFWDRAKPSYIQARDGTLDVNKVFWDDKFVDEIRQSLNACAVFYLMPIFYLADGGIGNQLNSMSTAMTLNGAPNDLISNFNPLAIIVFSPIITFIVYPFFSKIGRPLAPMTRMAIGSFLGCVGAVIAAIVQWKIYQTSPCGWEASTCDDVSPVSLWLQIPIYFFPAVGELFIVVTSYELAYTRSPARMKGLVYSLSLANNALSAAISLALANVIQDPYLIWPWIALAVGCFLLTFAYPIFFRHLNVPVEGFASRDRQAGLEQPKAIAEAQTTEYESAEKV